mgnify:CR=1 FL=1
MSTPFLIVGLGNPGARYAETRHNAGFWFLDRVAAQSGARLRPQPKLQAEVARVTLYGHDCLLARPITFMNHSGQAVRAVMDYYAARAESVPDARAFHERGSLFPEQDLPEPLVVQPVRDHAVPRRRRRGAEGARRR